MSSSKLQYSPAKHVLLLTSGARAREFGDLGWHSIRGHPSFRKELWNDHLKAWNARRVLDTACAAREVFKVKHCLMLVDSPIFTPEVPFSFRVIERSRSVGIVSTSYVRTSHIRALLLGAVGQLAGLPNCDTLQCPMYPIATADTLDSMRHKYCSRCRRILDCDA